MGPIAQSWHGRLGQEEGLQRPRSRCESTSQWPARLRDPGPVALAKRHDVGSTLRTRASGRCCAGSGAGCHEMHKGAGWAQPDLANNSLNLLEMRLRDLTAAGGTASKGAATSGPNIIVHSPTLLETTSVFAPSEGPRAPAYAADGQQVLRRVRDYTHIGDRNAGLEGHIAAVGDPHKTPFAILFSGSYEIGGARPVPTSLVVSAPSHSMP